jgi:hypothetical protein
MMVGFKRIGRKLTDLYVSPEDKMMQYVKSSFKKAKITAVSRAHVSG